MSLPYSLPSYRPLFPEGGNDLNSALMKYSAVPRSPDFKPNLHEVARRISHRSVSVSSKSRECKFACLFHPFHVHSAWLPDGDSRNRMSLALRASGLWLRYRYASKFDPFLSLDCIPRPPPWCNPRKGRDHILLSGNTGAEPPSLSLDSYVYLRWH